jgi:hypothetical protein
MTHESDRSGIIVAQWRLLIQSEIAYTEVLHMLKQASIWRLLPKSSVEDDFLKQLLEPGYHKRNHTGYMGLCTPSDHPVCRKLHLSPCPH